MGVSEQDSQSAYENFMEDSNKSILKTTQAISDMTGARATAKEELSNAKTDFSQTMTELEGLDQTNADLHKSCDFVLKISMQGRPPVQLRWMPSEKPRTFF